MTRRTLAVIVVSLVAVILALVPGVTPVPMTLPPVEAKPGDISVYVVYDRPTDFPGGFVVRRRVVRAGQDIPAEVVGTAPTLDDARKLVPAGTTKFTRDPADDPKIVESWF